MPAPKRPRFGSLQFYPRKRAGKFLHRVNWSTVSDNSEGLLGFITYKAGMATALIKDSTDKVSSSGKQVALPVTILEVPNMKIYAVRFYKFNKPVKDIVVSNDKELKRLLKVPKTLGNLDKVPEDYDDIRILAYSLVKETGIKKTPDIIEIAVSSPNKLEFIKNHLNKELTLSLFPKSSLVDIRALTTGRGLSGPVKRFGISLKGHKSEKGVRRPGSLGPWHPARVTFRTPLAGQLGLFSRITYNQKVISSGNIKEKDINISSGFPNYGKIRSSYLIVQGSVHGPVKRQVLITLPARPSKKQMKKKYEFLELI